MAVAGQWQIYNEAKLAMLNGTIDLDTDTFKVALFTSASNCGNVALQNARLTTLTNQVNTGRADYVAGGVTCAATWTGDYSAATKTFDLADAVWDASGGSITARFAVIYDDTATNKDLIAYCLLDSAPADVTVADGQRLTVGITNVFSLA